MATSRSTNSFYDRVGGSAVVKRLADDFYARVLSDPVLLPLFRDPNEDHAERMEWWLSEVFGGPGLHTHHRGGFATMVRAHGGLRISEAQRARWVQHMMAAAEDIGIPPVLRAEYRNYVDTASRLATNTSHQ